MMRVIAPAFSGRSSSAELLAEGGDATALTERGNGRAARMLLSCAKFGASK